MNTSERSITTIIFYTVIVLLSSCNQLTSPDNRKSYDIIEPVEITAEIEMIPEMPEEEPMEIKLFADYEKYVCIGGKLKGLSDKNISDVAVLDSEDNAILINQFCQSDSAVYFSTLVMETGDAIPDTDPVQYEAVEKEYFFMKSDGVISLIDEIPSFTADVRATMNDGHFKIEDAEYLGQTISKVSDGETYNNYIRVDGYYATPDGMWFSVPDSITHREAGIYYVARNSSRFVKVCAYGRIF